MHSAIGEMQCQVAPTCPDPSPWWLAGPPATPKQEPPPIVVEVEPELEYPNPSEPAFDTDWERWCEFAPLPVEFVYADIFYRHQMDHDGRRYLASPRYRRCLWCWQSDGQHSEACRELHDGWAVRMPWGKHKGSAVSDLAADAPDYLRWLIETADNLPRDLAIEVCRVLDLPEPEFTDDSDDARPVRQRFPKTPKTIPAADLAAVTEFLAERCDRGPYRSVGATELFSAYRDSISDYCHAMDARQFVIVMGALDFERIAQGGFAIRRRGFESRGHPMTPALKELHALALRQFERELPAETVAVIHGAARVAKAAGELPAAAAEQLDAGDLRTWWDLWRFGESLEGKAE